MSPVLVCAGCGEGGVAACVWAELGCSPLSPLSSVCVPGRVSAARNVKVAPRLQPPVPSSDTQYSRVLQLLHRCISAYIQTIQRRHPLLLHNNLLRDYLKQAFKYNLSMWDLGRLSAKPSLMSSLRLTKIRKLPVNEDLYGHGSQFQKEPSLNIVVCEADL